MSLNDPALNAFASTLVNCVRERAKGRDDKSARIVNSRPEEFVLAGFLTPRNVDGTGPQDEDDAATDLPQDSAYEQTAIGLEWMVDAETFSALDSIGVELAGHVYVRVFPSFDEQQSLGSWHVDRPQPGGSVGPRRQAVVPVWLRVNIPSFRVEVPVSELLAERKTVIGVEQHFALSLSPEELGAFIRHGAQSTSRKTI